MDYPVSCNHLVKIVKVYMPPFCGEIKMNILVHLYNLCLGGDLYTQGAVYVSPPPRRISALSFRRIFRRGAIFRPADLFRDTGIGKGYRKSCRRCTKALIYLERDHIGPRFY